MLKLDAPVIIIMSWSEAKSLGNICLLFWGDLFILRTDYHFSCTLQGNTPFLGTEA